MQDFLYPLSGVSEHGLEGDAGGEAAVVGQRGHSVGHEGRDQLVVIRMLTK